jgi:hypothetical protein
MHSVWLSLKAGWNMVELCERVTVTGDVGGNFSPYIWITGEKISAREAGGAVPTHNSGAFRDIPWVIRGTDPWAEMISPTTANPPRYPRTE